MFRFLKVFSIGLVALITMDVIWLGGIMSSFYATHLGHLARMAGGSISPDWLASLGAWALIVLGSIIFVLPRTENGSIVYAFCMGGMYGLVIYGVYDLSNYAVLAQWPWAVVVTDVAWGMVVNGLLAVILHLIA
jgi:uncharacterized membrane protein